MLPTECASMSRQFAGRGSDRVEAARSALKIAGEEGSRELIDIIRANCISRDRMRVELLDLSLLLENPIQRGSLTRELDRI